MLNKSFIWVYVIEYILFFNKKFVFCGMGFNLDCIILKTL